VADWIWENTKDKEWLPHFYERFGFGSLTGIDLPGETPGRVPTAAEEMELAKALGTQNQTDWTVGDWVNLAIGQGDLLVSPLQLAVAYSAVENGGTLVTPHVGSEIENQNGTVVKKISPKPAGHVRIPQTYLENAREGLRGVPANGVSGVPQHEGTAYPAFVGSKLPTLGKSGTGELPGGKDFVNWYVGWASNKPSNPLVVVVMLDGAGAFEDGSEMTAAPAVRHILESYYGIEQSKKDPYPTDAKPLGEMSAKENPRAPRAGAPAG
jgi:penicillin-binding protein 2